MLNHLVLLSAGLILLGCGAGQKTTAKLEISQGFAVSAAGFDGGLVIMGKNITTGETFSSDVLGGASMTIDLPLGTWRFSAVGWDGESTSLIFGGEPYCGSTIANLTLAEQTVSLNVNQAGCAAPLFSAGHVDAGVTPNTFKKMDHFALCNSFFDGAITPGSNIATSRVNTSTMTNYCDSLASDFHPEGQSIRIYAVRKPTPVSSAGNGFGSPCLPIDPATKSVVNLYGAGNAYNSNLLRLPYGEVPLHVTVFKDSSCGAILTEYRFPNGLDADTSSAFDKLLLPKASTFMKLILPGKESRRAMSPLLGILPSVECFSGSSYRCHTQPTSASVGSAIYHGYSGSVPANAFRLQLSSCNAVTWGGKVDSATCTDLGDEVEITFVGNATPGPGTISMSGNVYNVAISPGMADDLDRDLVHRKLIELLGPSVPVIPYTFFDGFYRNEHKDEDAFGQLSKVREMLGPAGPASLFPMPTSGSFLAACAGLSGVQERFFFNYTEGFEEGFRVEVSDVSNSAGTFFCDLGNTNQGSCPDMMTKRMKVFDYKQSSLAPAIVVEFNCQTPFGKLEEYHFDETLTTRSTDRSMVQWNTDLSANTNYQRFDYAVFHEVEKYTGSWVPYSKNYSMGRVHKIGTENAQIWDYNFSSQFTGSMWDQQVSSLQTSNFTSFADKGCYTLGQQSTTNADSVFLINNNALAATPSNVEGAKSFHIGGAWPQSVTVPSGSCPGFVALPSGDGLKILGLIDFDPHDLDDIPGIFGSTFYTNP